MMMIGRIGTEPLGGRLEAGLETVASKAPKLRLVRRGCTWLPKGGWDCGWIAKSELVQSQGACNAVMMVKLRKGRQRWDGWNEERGEAQLRETMSEDGGE